MASKSSSIPGRFNNFFMIKENSPFFDSTSKFFITFEAILGINRLPLVFEIGFYKRCFMFFYVLLCIFVVMSFPLIFYSDCETAIIVACTLIEYMACSIFSYAFINRLRSYYQELYQFDLKVGCQFKVSPRFIINVCMYLILIILMYLAFYFSLKQRYLFFLILHVLPLRVVHVLELHFYGYLLSLIEPRMRLLFDLVAVSLSSKHSEVERESIRNMCSGLQQPGQCISLYNIVITAHQKLVNAIKWQFMIIITMSFFGTLCMTYQISMNIIKGHLYGNYWLLISYVSLCVCNSMPLFSPCLVEDKLKGEVGRIRRLIASRLHDQNINKSSRSTARDLLSMTKVRDFSFSLMGMFNVDVTLPFKFISLVVSYVVILLQFEKVFQIEF